jgi:hypothetical protein
MPGTCGWAYADGTWNIVYETLSHADLDLKK